MKSYLQIAVISASIFLSSCASKFTPAQRDALSTVAISKGTLGEDAYEDPYGGDVAMRNNSSNVHGAGALGPLVGLAIGSAVAGTQNNMFVGKNQGYFPAVKKNMPNNLGEVMTAKLKASLKNDPFFSKRLKDSSPNTVTSEITSTRLIRLSKNSSGELLFTPEVYATIELKDSAGKNLAGGGSYIGHGTDTYTVAEYAASPEKLRKAYDGAIQSAVTQFMTLLATKTKD